MSRLNLLRYGIPILLFIGCNRPIASSPTPDLFATLQASTPSGLASPVATPNATSGGSTGGFTVPLPSTGDELTGHIVFTCQLFKVQAMDQICIMNADGSGMRRLTTENNKRHFYPALAPDGQSVLYTSFREQNVYEIYSFDLNDESVDQLTDRLGVLTAPEVSPDGTSITFARGNPSSGSYQIMVMDRDGGNVDNIPQVAGWDPTWSPDGQQILFASGAEGAAQLFVVKLNGSDLHRVSNLPAIRGRSDWSADGQSIVTYSGPAWNREVYIMNADGLNARQLTPSGGN
ncbi:MAG TPA: hypothetical protein VFT30_07315, partial [Nitrospira sp.]|nr:hypothetical protein [Nitrospira sp.]